MPKKVNLVSATFTVNMYPYAQRWPARHCLDHLAERGCRSVDVMLVPRAIEFPNIAKRHRSLGYAYDVLEILDDPDRALSHSETSLQEFGWPAGPSH